MLLGMSKATLDYSPIPLDERVAFWLLVRVRMLHFCA